MKIKSLNILIAFILITSMFAVSAQAVNVKANNVNADDSNADNPNAVNAKAIDGRFAIKTSSEIYVDGKLVSPEAYNYKGNNYLKIRDIAFLLSGSKKQFDVSWYSNNNAINLLTNKPYNITGVEMHSQHQLPLAIATTSKSKIFLDFSEIYIASYNINKNRYFKLREIGKIMNFAIQWDAEKDAIYIKLDEEYREDIDVLANDISVNGLSENNEAENSEAENISSESNVQEFYVELDMGFNPFFTVTNVVNSHTDYPDFVKYDYSITAKTSSELVFNGLIFQSISIEKEGVLYKCDVADSHKGYNPISEVVEESNKILVPDGDVLPAHFDMGYTLKLHNAGTYIVYIASLGYEIYLEMIIID